jgi:hypothetical protein
MLFSGWVLACSAGEPALAVVLLDCGLFGAGRCMVLEGSGVQYAGKPCDMPCTGQESITWLEFHPCSDNLVLILPLSMCSKVVATQEVLVMNLVGPQASRPWW